MKVSSFDAALPFAAAPAARHVLVVESDPDQRRRVVTQLSNWGYSPLAAGSGL
jgi:CheY-like chemotaxis protein